MRKKTRREDFFREYRERYNSYWIRRFGMIPELPTSLDNSNSIYELLAWLQRAFKGLLDDFINMQLEFDEFKNALLDLLEEIIPQLIRQYIHSDEFRNIILGIIDDWYNSFLKPILDRMEERIEKNENDIKDLQNDIKDLQNAIDEINNYIDNIKNLIDNLEKKIDELTKDFEDKIKDLGDKLDTLENNSNNEALEKILTQLESIGVWDKSSNDFKNNMGIAGGNINLFGGEPDGSFYIKTNNKNSENDLTGGI